MVMLKSDGTLPGSDVVVLRSPPPENNNDDRYEGQHRLPSYARVQVPIGNKYSNRRVAEILERLAHRLRLLQADPELSVNRARLLTWFEIKSANSDLQEITKSSKTERI